MGEESERKRKGRRQGEKRIGRMEGEWGVREEINE